ncbi:MULTISPECIES: hypothetical protein [unclassified Actinotalea]|uniref:hypothetical protein n=1 Tax=unclassified Actinotalea TaxID=2638618 RepID=UPI0015F63859|nr:MULTISPECIES: hypothetical protein [unclassified Actinotalea]
MADGSPAAGGARRGLGPGLTTFVVVDVILVVTFFILLAMSGGGGGGEPVAEPEPSPASVEPETTPEASAPEEPEDVEALPAFTLPSGNIWCSMTDTSATCTIFSFTYPAPDLPEGCTGTAGNVLEVVVGQDPRFACVEGSPPSPPEGTPMLDYGQGSTIGEMTCLSSRNGVFCRHNPTGDGFSLARAGAQFF